MPLESPPAFTTYLDLDGDLKPWLNLANVTGRDDVLTTVLDFACQWVQTFLQQPVAPIDVVEYCDGGSDSIMLRYCPLISVTSVSEYWATSGLHTLTEQTPSAEGGPDTYQVDYLTGRIIRTFPGLWPRIFFPGLRNVVIDYQAGYQVIPAPIRQATLEYAKYYWRRSQDPRQSRSNDYDGEAGTDLWPGIPNRVTDLLEPYKQVVFG